MSLGNAAAKNKKLTVEGPSNSHILGIFSTENYSKININSSTLEIFFPRFIQGDGSDIRIYIFTNYKANTSSIYNIYLTYDQGSKKMAINSSAKSDDKGKDITDSIISLLLPLATAIAATISGFVTLHYEFIVNESLKGH